MYNYLLINTARVRSANKRDENGPFLGSPHTAFFTYILQHVTSTYLLWWQLLGRYDIVFLLKKNYVGYIRMIYLVFMPFHIYIKRRISRLFLQTKNRRIKFDAQRNLFYNRIEIVKTSTFLTLYFTTTERQE